VRVALTLTNRETFLVLDWLDSDPARRARLCQRAAELTPSGGSVHISRLSELVYQEIRAELPELRGLAALILDCGLRRVNCYELALALLSSEKVSPRAREQ
jgi:hypothetical protein